MQPFPATRLSIVEGLRSSREPIRRASWDALVSAYWKPAYKYARLKWRLPPADGADLIQAFFGRALEKEFFSSFDPSRGRFRTFFRVCLDRHAANESAAQHRLKRGGGDLPLSLEFDVAEAEMTRTNWEGTSPDEVFDREWRRSVVGSAIDSLREACRRADKGTAFLLFERYDLGDAEVRPTYADLGQEFGLPVTTVTNQLAFARREFRAHVLEVLEQITADREELRAEAKALLGVDLE